MYSPSTAIPGTCFLAALIASTGCQSPRDTSFSLPTPGMDVVAVATHLENQASRQTLTAEVRFEADVAAESIIVRGANSEQKRAIEELFAECIGAATSEPSIEFIEVEHASAAAVAESIRVWLGGPAQSRIRIFVDQRTNRLCVVGATLREIALIETRVAKLDTP